MPLKTKYNYFDKYSKSELKKNIEQYLGKQEEETNLVADRLDKIFGQ